MSINFGRLLAGTKSTTKGKAGALKVGDLIKPSLRSDGGEGFVMRIGRVMRGETYASRKNPIQLTVKIQTKDGQEKEETLPVTDADGVHLGKVNKAEVEAMLAEISRMEVVEIK